MRRPDSRDKRLADLLKANGRLITLRQAATAGFTPNDLYHYVQRGRLCRLRRGVFVDAGARRTPQLVLRAAIAEAGEGAVASHRSAAAVYELIPRYPAIPQITVGRNRRMRTAGVVVHRSAVTIERTIWGGDRTPSTTASRTLLDLATLASSTLAALQSWIDQAIVRNLTAVPKLVDMVRTWPGGRCPGGPRLLLALESGGFLAGPEASALERRTALLLRPVCAAAGIPMPVAEHVVADGRYRLDFAWPQLHFAVEVDGYLWHHSPEAMNRDSKRRITLKGLGWEVMAFTWHQVVHEPEWVAAQVLDALRRQMAGVR